MKVQQKVSKRRRLRYNYYGHTTDTVFKKPALIALGCFCVLLFVIVVGRVNGNKESDRHPLSAVSGGNGQPIAEFQEKGKTVVYTVDEDMQKKAEKLVLDSKSIYSSFIAMDVSTGKILTFATQYRGKLVPYYDVNNVSYKAVVPCASIFKIVTASAGLESGLVNKNSCFNCRGYLYIARRQGVSDPKNVRHQDISFREAFAKSCNVTFGKIGLLVGRDRIAEYGRKFRFGEKIDFDFLLQASKMDSGKSVLDLAKFACGEGDVTMTPVHGVLLAQTIANGGVMMKPYIIDRILKKNGKPEYSAKPESVGRVIEPGTADILKDFMKGTVEIKRASANRKFHDRRGRSLFPGAEVAGKTGSLYSRNPGTEGWCTWFVGHMNYKGREIAVATTVVNGSVWKVKANLLTVQILQKFYQNSS